MPYVFDRKKDAGRNVLTSKSLHNNRLHSMIGQIQGRTLPSRGTRNPISGPLLLT